MSTKTKSPLLSAPVLVVLLALVLAVAGVVYTHWADTLYIEGSVQTGQVAVMWNEAWTNDDGVNNADSEPVWGTDWDGTSTSADPKENNTNPARYTKDVAECYANGGGDRLQVDLYGAYPSYNCNMTGIINVNGNVPVRATAFDFTGQKVWFNEVGNQVSGPLVVTYEGNEGNFQLGVDAGVHEIEGDIGQGVRCGAQLDPSGCQWYITADDRGWNGPVSFDEANGSFADVDGQEVVCNDGNTACWVEGDYQPNGVYNPSNGDFLVYQECSGVTTPVEGWLHVLQEADQNANYSFEIQQDFVNWNEFDYCMCTNGVPAADIHGEIIGLVDRSEEGSGDCLLGG